MAAAATAFCTSNTSFHQHSLTTKRSPYTSISRRTLVSPSTSFSSAASLSHIEQQSILTTIKSDENNNNNNSHRIDNINLTNIDEVLYITSDDDDINDDLENDKNSINDNNEEQFLALLGLRPKNKKQTVPNRSLPPLKKRLACPVCLLPLPKYKERVRQALYIRLPFLKILSIIKNIEQFCATDDNAKAQRLLSRSATLARASVTSNKSQRRQKSSKPDVINVSTTTVRSYTSRLSTKGYVQSTFQCRVVLDRLEQSALDELMKNSSEKNDKINETIKTSDRSLSRTSSKICQLSSITSNETTTTTEKTTVKRKLTTTEVTQSKRLKSVENNCITINDDNTNNDSSSLTYERIYLKCFVCSKRQYINAQVTDSHVLHIHWLEHNKDLSINIYDSEIDSIATRVVEFFQQPKQHVLEGRIQTVFILNSKEVRSKSTYNSCSNDPCITID